MNNTVNTNTVNKTINVKSGDVFVSSGGYGQTNIAFYRIEKVKNKTVEITELDKIDSHDSQSMSGKTIPNLSAPGHNRKTVRIKISSYSGIPTFKGIWGGTYPWDGTPQFFSYWH